MQFFTKLLDVANAGKPLMRSYLPGYFDLYWDLHLGLRSDTIPTRVLQFGESLNTVLAYRDPTQKIVYENYMFVHANLAFLRGWIAEKLAHLNNRKIANPERTFAYYWVRNAEDGENFQVEDIISECIHDFFAFSQLGTTIYNIMLKLSMSSGDPETKAWFKKTMESNFDDTDGMPFTPLERFVMELLRVITPNRGSLSRIGEIGTSRHESRAYLLVPTRSRTSIKYIGKITRSSTPIATTRYLRATKSTRVPASKSALSDVRLRERHSMSETVGASCCIIVGLVRSTALSTAGRSPYATAPDSRRSVLDIAVAQVSNSRLRSSKTS